MRRKSMDPYVSALALAVVATLACVISFRALASPGCAPEAIPYVTTMPSG